MRLQNIFLVNGRLAAGDIPGDFERWFSSKLGEKVVTASRLAGGINSESFQVVTDQKQKYVVKKYQRRKGDRRDRIATEYGGLCFLWANGIRNIPQPLFISQPLQIAVYRFIEGKKISSGHLTRHDIKQAADFAGKLHALTKGKKAAQQPVASEAYFCVLDHIDCLERRIEKLKDAGRQCSVPSPFISYFRKEILPFFAQLKKETLQKAKDLSLDSKRILPKSLWTLSASDFGFHNAIKAADGQIYFIDFEYFGWDDPVKFIADFYLQPAVPVAVNYREFFFEQVRKNYHEGCSLEKRLAVVYPLLGFKWCLIMMNSLFRSDKNTPRELLGCLTRSAKKLNEIKKEISKKVFPL